MIIICENCSAKYVVSDKSLGNKGRNVKCAKCNQTWFAKPSDEKQENVVTESTGKEVISIDFNLKTLPVICIKKIFSLINIMPIIFAIAIVCTILIFFNDIASKLPVINKLYEFTGNYYTGDIVLRDISIRKIQQKQYKNLVIKGYITNISETIKVVPKLRFAIRDYNGNVLLRQTISFKATKLKPHQIFPINSTIKNIQDNASILEIDIGNKIQLMLR